MMRMRWCVAFVVAMAAVLLWARGNDARAEPCRAVWEGGYYTPDGLQATAMFSRMEHGRPVAYAARASGLSYFWPNSGVVRVGSNGVTPLAATMESGVINCVLIVDERPWGGLGETVYVGGDFVPPAHPSVPLRPRNLARWTGEAWAPVGASSGAGPNGAVFALALFDDGRGGPPRLYAGGDFVYVGGEIGTRIASFDGSTWRGLSVATSQPVTSLAVHDDGSGPALFIGGMFRQVQLSPTDPWTVARGVAKWDGERWSGVDTRYLLNVNGMVSADLGRGRRLYAVGTGGDIFGGRHEGIFELAGGLWSVIPAPVYGAVTAIPDGQEGRDRLYLRFARYDGVSFQQLLGDQADRFGYAEAGPHSGPQVISDYFSRLDGSTWRPLLLGVPRDGGYSRVFATLDLGDGPALTYAAQVQSRLSILQRRSGVWEPRIGSSQYGAPSGARRIAASANGIWLVDARGALYRRTGQDVWTPLLPGAAIVDIALFDDGSGEALYVLGIFGSGGVVYGPVSRLRAGVLERVGDLRRWPYYVQLTSFAVFDDGSGARLFASGDFAFADPVNGSDLYAPVAVWNGVAWSPAGERLGNRYVGARGGLFVTRSPSGAASLFNSSGFEPLRRWVGEGWEFLGSAPVNVSSVVEVREAGRPVLYAISDNYFPSPLSGLIKWDGLRWLPVSGSPPRSGISQSIVVTDPDGDAWVQGSFSEIAGVPTDNFARLIMPCVASCAGDVTGDRLVDMADLAALLAAYGSSSPPSDIDNSGRVDFADLNLLLAGYGRACP